MPFEVAVDRQYCAPSAAAGVTITRNATNWANGTWVEISASTPEAWVLTGVQLVSLSTSPFYEMEMDIGVGAAASEVVIATICGWVINSNASTPYFIFPIPIDAIAASSRVSARMRGAAGSTSGNFAASIAYL